MKPDFYPKTSKKNYEQFYVKKWVFGYFLKRALFKFNQIQYTVYSNVPRKLWILTWIAILFNKHMDPRNPHFADTLLQVHFAWTDVLTSKWSLLVDHCFSVDVEVWNVVWWNILLPRRPTLSFGHHARILRTKYNHLFAHEVWSWQMIKSDEAIFLSKKSEIIFKINLMSKITNF